MEEIRNLQLRYPEDPRAVLTYLGVISMENYEGKLLGDILIREFCLSQGLAMRGDRFSRENLEMLARAVTRVDIMKYKPLVMSGLRVALHTERCWVHHPSREEMLRDCSKIFGDQDFCGALAGVLSALFQPPVAHFC